MSNPKERPILFNGEMVRAVLVGRKTQTRRVIKDTGLYAIDSNIHGEVVSAREITNLIANKSPYGKPGDRLWVRETFSPALIEGFPNAPTGNIVYRADCRDRNGDHWTSVAENPKEVIWKPSILLKRVDARILLEVTDVRVERVNEITADDARAEGHHVREGHTQEVNDDAALDWFMDLWDSINGNRIDKDKNRLPYAWGDNPWVWVVDFKVIDVKGGRS